LKLSSSAKSRTLKGGFTVAKKVAKKAVKKAPAKKAAKKAPAKKKMGGCCCK